MQEVRLEGLTLRVESVQRSMRLFATEVMPALAPARV